MKKTLLLAACALCVAALSAQTRWSSEPDHSVEFGPRLGLNVSSMSNLSLNSKAGVNVGMGVNVGIVKSMYINTGLYFTTKGACGSFRGIGDETLIEYRYKRNYHPMYLEIPVQASYRYDLSSDVQWQLNFGPYFALGVGGKYTYKNEILDTPEEKLDMFGGDPDQMGCHRFEMGLGVGTGITYRNYFVGVNYNFGLTNVYNYDALKLGFDDGSFGITHTKKSVKNGVFSINVGYNF